MPRLNAFLAALVVCASVALGARASVVPGQAGGGGGGGGGVSSITGTANQVVASASTGAVTLSLPQSIGTGNAPAFAGATFNGTVELGPGSPIESFGGNPINITTAGSQPINFSTAGTLAMAIAADRGVTLGAPTGGDQGAGTLNATGLYVNGLAVAGGGSGLTDPTIKCWFEADSGTYQDSGLTTPATANGAPIGGWVDKGPQGINALQSTSGHRCALATNAVNGHPAITAGSSLFLQSAADCGLGPYCWCVATLSRTWATNTGYSVLWGTSTTPTGTSGNSCFANISTPIGNFPSNGLGLFTCGYSASYVPQCYTTATTAGLTGSSYATISWVCGEAWGGVRVNGVPVASTFYGGLYGSVAGPGTLLLFSNGSGSTFSDVSLAACMIGGGSTSLASIAQIEAYQMTKYGT